MQPQPPGSGKQDHWFEKSERGRAIQFGAFAQFNFAPVICNEFENLSKVWR